MIELPIANSKTTVKNGILALEKIIQEAQPIEAKVWKKIEDKVSLVLYRTYKDMEKETNPERKNPELWDMKSEEREEWRKTPEGIAFDKALDRYYEISKVFSASFPYHIENLPEVLAAREQEKGKFEGEAKEIDEKIIKFMKSWLPVVELVAEAKKFIIEKVTKKQQQEKEKKMFLRPIQNKEILTKVRTLLEENIQSEFANLLKSMEKFYEKRLEEIKEAVKMHAQFIKDNPTLGTHNKSWYSFKKEKLSDLESFLSQKIVSSTSGSYSDESVQVSPNAEEIFKKLALEDATSMKENYIYKNMLKMQAIVGQKDKNGVSISSSSAKGAFNHATFEGWLHLEFSDGTKFGVKNQLVWAMSKYDKIFTRFPTTFHDVTFKNGKTQSMVPEKEMIEIWSKQ